MIYENWLHINALDKKTSYCPPLKKNIECDFLVIGGGITGLHAALRLVESGKKNIVLLEKRICGGGSSGQSGGFLSPESEEDMQALFNDYGKEKGKITTIKLEYETKERLDRLKEHEKESYNQVIKKMLHLLNIFRKNPEQGNKILRAIDTAIKRKKVYLSIPTEKEKQ